MYRVSDKLLGRLAAANGQAASETAAAQSERRTLACLLAMGFTCWA